MTDKQLQKLGRRDLLQLLLDQAKETEQLREEVAAAAERAKEMEKTFQRLRERLDEKDAKIREMGETYDRLRDRLNDKDAQIQELNNTLQAEREGKVSALTEVGSIAEAALRLNGIFEAAQRAADLYLQKIQESRPAAENVVMADNVVIEPSRTEPATPVITPPVRPVVDVEPKAETASPPPPPPQPAKEEPRRQGLFPKRKRKEKENRGKFVLSFGWEEK